MNDVKNLWAKFLPPTASTHSRAMPTGCGGARPGGVWQPPRRPRKDPRMARLDEPDENEPDNPEPTKCTKPTAAVGLSISSKQVLQAYSMPANVPDAASHGSPTDVISALADEDELPVTSIPLRGPLESVQSLVKTAISTILSQRPSIEDGRVVADAAAKLKSVDPTQQATIELLLVERESRELVERWDLHAHILDGSSQADEEFVRSVIEKQVRRTCTFLPGSSAPLEVQLRLRLQEHAHATLDESPVEEYEKLHTPTAAPAVTPDTTQAAQARSGLTVALWAAVAVGAAAVVAAACSGRVRAACGL